MNTLIRVIGGHPLSGRVSVQGSKNVALHLYAATLLVDSPITLTSVPDILDTEVCAQVLRHTGAVVTVENNQFTVIPPRDVHPVIHPQSGRRIRTTAVMAAAMLADTGQVTFPYPGGDAFCPRLIDRHLAAMRAAGAEVTETGTGIHARCGPRGVKAFTVDVNTPYGPSLGATVTAMLLAARAPGTSLITHPSIEPEVIETARFLSERGVRIAFDDHFLHVFGSDRLAGGTFTVAGDRIEAATMVMAAAATGGAIQLRNITVTDIPVGLARVLTAVGVTLTGSEGGGIQMAPCETLNAIEAATGPHPGLPTDTAPQLASMLTQAKGTSLIGERVYPRRDTHVEGLRTFGADVTGSGSMIRVHGPTRLHHAAVEGADIRAVTALVIASLVAEGTSTIRGVDHLRRGYGHLLSNLAALGAEITLIPGDS